MRGEGGGGGGGGGSGTVLLLKRPAGNNGNPRARPMQSANANAREIHRRRIIILFQRNVTCYVTRRYANLQREVLCEKVLFPPSVPARGFALRPPEIRENGSGEGNASRAISIPSASRRWLIQRATMNALGVTTRHVTAFAIGRGRGAALPLNPL